MFSSGLMDLFPQAKAGDVRSMLLLWEERGRPSAGEFAMWLHGPKVTTEQFDMTVDAAHAGRALADARADR